MNTATQVDQLISGWKKDGLSKSEIIAKTAEASLGWPYVFGARGQYCTSSYRKQRATATGGAEGNEIIKKCQILRGSKDTCIRCSFYPGGQTRCFDCRGYTYWLCAQVDIRINGAGATSQWNDNNNWIEKGSISDMPMDKVCVVFWRDKSDSKVMAHTGMYLGNGDIIHCSGTVKKGKPSDKGWTDYAIPVGLEGSDPGKKPTLRNGSSGAYVVELQQDLIRLGYSVGKTGADGKFGKNTEAGVKAFQKNHNLKQDGIVSDDVWEAIEKELNPGTLYTVTIKHMTLDQADAICRTYPSASKKAEVNDNV